MSIYFSLGIQPLVVFQKFSNILQLICQLNLTILKKLEDCDILSFLCSVLQVHLEFWNSTDPFTEYGPDFTKSSDLIQQECEHMICETVSLLKHIRSCQYLPNLNTVKTMDKLQKLNGDLIFILDEYFYMNIWKPID